MKVTAFTDGATWMTNPGPAGIGVVFYYGINADKVLLRYHTMPSDATLCEPIGHATNNEAEYRAVVRAIEHFILELPGDALDIRSDSNLVVSQVGGDWVTRAKHLRPWQAQVRHLIDLLRGAEILVEIHHISRMYNDPADKLSKIAAQMAAESV